MITRVAFLLAFAACGASSKPNAPAPAESAPQLFTIEQLRDGIPAGRVIELRMELEGKPATTEHWEFTKVDANGATIHSVTRDDAGTIVADQTGTSAWAELHSHAKFPAAATTIEDNVTLTVPAGTFTTRLYKVKVEGATRRFWFAVDLPGPPVQFTTEKEGKVVMRAVMLRVR
ncbi:MAG: hypothetical protein ACKV2T_17085 [Kofleriaceae bacterium]